MDLTYEKQAELVKLTDNYKVVESFIEENKRLSYMQFDYAVVHGLTLFMIEPDFSFDVLEDKINAILAVLPAVKRIFAQPCIHLKEQDVILPTESVRIINNNTVQHISSHSELWTDVKKDEIKPSRLLTRTYEDNYGIYENLVFCQTVDEILAFSRIYTRFFKELIYTNQTIEINLLERVNHLNYFLALGKLHIGYSRSFEAYYPVSMRCLNKLQFITNSIVPRLKRPVYKNNRIRPTQIKVRKTNILSMHKEYHQIYKFAKTFTFRGLNSDRELDGKDIAKLQKSYFEFCEALCVFAVSHFNFSCGQDASVDFSRLCVTFKFKDWKLKLKRIKCAETPVISVVIEKNVKYKILLIPSVFADNEELSNSVKEAEQADEYIVCTPYEDAENCLLIDITGIESFRRIQQFVLRGMVYSDSERKDCPFCNNELVLNAEKSTDDRPVYECVSCRTEIHRGYCPTEKKPYDYILISGLGKASFSDDDLWLAKRKAESQMFFRNITELTDDMEIVCPHCHKVHK